MRINLREFNEIIGNFNHLEHFRTDIWHRCKKLIKNGFRYESYILLLSTWNINRFKIFMTKMQPETILSLIEKTQKLYSKISHLTFETLDFSNVNSIKKIKKIYKLHSEIKGIEYTGATKLMCLERTNLFVMWDTKIRKFYNIRTTTPEDYIKFLKIMKLEFGHLKKTTLAKSIDEFNFVKIVKMLENEI